MERENGRVRGRNHGAAAVSAPENHVKETRDVPSPCGETVGEYIASVQKASSGLVDATVEQHWDYEIYVEGWRPMTEKELERAEKRRQKAREAAAKRRQTAEQKERALLAKLQAKYGEPQP